jgi:hypothetical protein
MQQHSLLAFCVECQQLPHDATPGIGISANFRRMLHTRMHAASLTSCSECNMQIATQPRACMRRCATSRPYLCAAVCHGVYYEARGFKQGACDRVVVAAAAATSSLLSASHQQLASRAAAPVVLEAAATAAAVAVEVITLVSAAKKTAARERALQCCFAE